ncbi:MAG: DUF1926 domain-containing protein [Spirochaetia bacterium]|nr:DUF1926 domain-containing protein [Spirochaetia bacterium]
MKIVLGLYHSKPQGTANEEHEFALYHCYRPILTYLYANSDVKLAFYLSGSIYEWLESNFPEINMLMKDLIKRGQIEILSGGFYDPAFPLIVQKDRGMQIEMMNTYIRKRFGKKPHGGWMPDQLWNPNLVTTLNSCDINYIISFDPDEKKKRKRDKTWYNPYVMMDIGKSITILPASDLISRLIPFESAFEITHKIHMELKHTESEVITLMMNADSLISNFLLKDNSNLIGYLDQLINELEKNDIKLDLPSLSLKNILKNRGHLKAGWYNHEFIDDETIDFHDMLHKYPEAFTTYNKMFYIQKLIAGIRKDKSRKKSASLEVMKSQSAMYFWPEKNGGIYKNYLRKEQHKHLIEAEKITREKGVFTTSLNTFDLDADERDEYIYRGKNITAVIDSKGASLSSLDYLVSSWNYLDTFTGRQNDDFFISPYKYGESCRQNCFSDIFTSHPDITIEKKYDKNSSINLEQDLYEVKDYDKESKVVCLTNTIHEVIDQKVVSVNIEKQFLCRSNSVEVKYEIKNTTDNPLDIYFISELNLSFGFEGIEYVSIKKADAEKNIKLEQNNELTNVKHLQINDNVNKTQLSIFTNKRCTVRTENYSTTIQTRFGEEDIYQHTVFSPMWHVAIPGNETWHNSVGLRIEKRKSHIRRH